MTNAIHVCFVALALSTATDVLAQRRPVVSDTVEQQDKIRADMRGAPEPDFARYLFPPELIMQFQQKINLRPEQRTTITQAIQQMQSKVVDLQWQMQAEVQKLTEIMQHATIKEAEALAQVDRVLGIEREVKRTHLGMLIRIKNTLGREQQVALDSIQATAAGRGRPE